MTTRFDRRSFLCTLVGGVAATAAVRTWPFRVFSFPSEIARPRVIWKALGARSANYLENDFKYPGYYGPWDWDILAQREAQTLFVLPRDLQP